MSEMSLQLGVQFQLLKTNLVAVYEKNGNDSSFLLVPAKLDDVGSTTLSDMLKDLQEAFGNQVNQKDRRWPRVVKYWK
ncbi:hypothetical protein [Pedobacter sp. P26]|uniref:hypothetical protein n=1 Tax=Pedobacter sp. P26 TaxID=3423956 RepID=UPI003D667C09